MMESLRLSSKNKQTAWARENASYQVAVDFVLNLIGLDCMARVFWINHILKWNKTKGVPNDFRHSIKNCSGSEDQFSLMICVKYSNKEKKFIAWWNKNKMVFSYLHTACTSWHGFHEASNTTTRFAPIRLIPRHPALEEGHEEI